MIAITPQSVILVIVLTCDHIAIELFDTENMKALLLSFAGNSVL